MLRTSALALWGVALVGALFTSLPVTRATKGLLSLEEDDYDALTVTSEWLDSHSATRNLQDAQAKWKTVVKSPAAFMKAVAQGDRHIEVQEHLDFSTFDVSKIFNWTATFHLPETVKTIKGNCASQFPDGVTSGLEGAPILPQRPGQCLLTFDNIFMAAQSSTGKKLWMDSLYLRDSRGQTNSSMSDAVSDDSGGQVIVMLASGKKYDEAPASTARKLYLTNVTVQGNGVDGSRGLYNTGKLFAQDSVFAHLGNVEGLPPVKIRLKKATANFQDCLFLENYSPNFFGPIMAEDKAAVRLQQSVFSGNEPELLDAFSKGAFYSDESISVWNDDDGAYETTKSLAEGDEEATWLFGDDVFLTKMRSRYGLPPLEPLVTATPPEAAGPITGPEPVEGPGSTSGPGPADPVSGPESDGGDAPDPADGSSDGTPDGDSSAPEPDLSPEGDTDDIDPNNPDGVVDGGDKGDETDGEVKPPVDPGVIGGAVAGAVLVLVGVGCFVWGRRSRKKTQKSDLPPQTPGYPAQGIPGYTSGPLTPGIGFVHPPGSVHIPSAMHGSMHNMHGGSWGSQGSALPPMMTPNPYHPVTITRMGGHGVDHDVDTGIVPASATGSGNNVHSGQASTAGKDSGVGFVPSSSALAPGPNQSAAAVKHTYDTNYEEDFDELDPPSASAPVDDKMAYLQYQLDSIGREQSILNGLVMLGGGRFERLQGGQAIVQMARNRVNGLDYAIKFFISNSAFESEKELYIDETSPLGKFLPQVRDIVDNDDCVLVDPRGNPLPPCIVMERGESLDIWSARARPDRWQAFTCIQHLANRLVNLHGEGYVHRDLKPGNVMWLPRENRWTVIDFGCAAKTGKEAGLGFSIMYAAPEVIAAYRGGKRKMKVTEALDVWSLGVLAIELLTGEMPLNLQEGAKAIMDRIEGKDEKQLPWEEDKNRKYYNHKLGLFKNTLLELLDRDPAGRPSMRQFSAACSAILGGTATVDDAED